MMLSRTKGIRVCLLPVPPAEQLPAKKSAPGSSSNLFAQRESTGTSVGENAVLVLKAEQIITKLGSNRAASPRRAWFPDPWSSEETECAVGMPGVRSRFVWPAGIQTPVPGANTRMLLIQSAAADRKSCDGVIV